MRTKITHLILSTVFAVSLAYMASIVTIMIIPILGYMLTAIAQIMEDNFDITIQIFCWVYSVVFVYWLYKKSPN